MGEGAAKRAIKGQGRTIAWLARKVNLSRSQVSRQLDGIKPLSFEQAERMAELTNLPVELFPITENDEAREAVPA